MLELAFMLYKILRSHCHEQSHCVFRIMKSCALAGGYWYIGRIFWVCVQGALFGKNKVD